MKLTTNTITAIIAFFATTSVAKMEGGFIKDCKNIHLEKMVSEQGPTFAYYKVRALCTGMDEKPYENELNLNLCLVNGRGNLSWRERGKFDKTCKECQLVSGDKKKVEMKCRCANGVFDVWKDNLIDLSELEP
ncbi:hypothetical protein BDP81DRAFT_395278 [Colletotrichum phormii]|uniref:Cyanovirin-N domain-containing protein n=1 Tax=Colletotrichum phormii TaxID=359342 RepID=A0AAJ0EE75_9PEZI|nr:uncharacterized protein BDP81DRAFT_395278 [Colletotrichum phormii]KAK1635724.1 hypothetical protein BDP81DRAFT_395278 [Colletotrichum phormii]